MNEKFCILNRFSLTFTRERYIYKFLYIHVHTHIFIYIYIYTSRHFLSQKLWHFHKNTHPCVENECCCPRRVNILNVNFTSNIYIYIYVCVCVCVCVRVFFEGICVAKFLPRLVLCEITKFHVAPYKLCSLYRLCVTTYQYVCANCFEVQTVIQT